MSAPTEHPEPRVHTAREVFWGFQEASLLNEGDKSGHKPIFGCFLRGKQLTKQLLMFPLGRLTQCFFRGLSPKERKVGTAVGFLRKQGLCSHVAYLLESHFNNHLSQEQVYLKHQYESQKVQCGAWCISNWGCCAIWASLEGHRAERLLAHLSV